MKSLLWTLLAGALVVSGCAQHYVIKLSNNRQIATASKPKLKGGAYHYKDASGHDQVVSQARVREIEPASMVAEENKFTVQKPKKSHWYWPF